MRLDWMEDAPKLLKETAGVAIFWWTRAGNKDQPPFCTCCLASLCLANWLLHIRVPGPGVTHPGQGQQSESLAVFLKQTHSIKNYVLTYQILSAPTRDTQSLTNMDARKLIYGDTHTLLINTNKGPEIVDQQRRGWWPCWSTKPHGWYRQPFVDQQCRRP